MKCATELDDLESEARSLKDRLAQIDRLLLSKKLSDIKQELIGLSERAHHLSEYKVKIEYEINVVAESEHDAKEACSRAISEINSTAGRFVKTSIVSKKSHVGDDHIYSPQTISLINSMYRGFGKLRNLAPYVPQHWNRNISNIENAKLLGSIIKEMKDG